MAGGACTTGLLDFGLRVTDEAIEVRGFGPFGRLMEAFGPLKLTLAPRETTMRTARLTRTETWRGPRSKADFVALSSKLPDGSEYTLAVRPSDGDLDRLRNALEMAGVSAS
jgi:hypothetical protein